MTRLIDLGLNRLSSIILEMATLGENTVITAIASYKEDNLETTKKIFESSSKLRFLQDEVSVLTIELIARFQPVATDLRYIKSCMEISYGFSRFGRYAYDIITVLENLGPLKLCDKSSVICMSEIVLDLMKQVYLLCFCLTYKKSMRESTQIVNQDNLYSYNRCNISSALKMKYLERFSDHACYIADSVNYIVTGVTSPRG